MLQPWKFVSLKSSVDFVVFVVVVVGVVVVEVVVVVVVLVVVMSIQLYFSPNHWPVESHLKCFEPTSL